MSGRAALMCTTGLEDPERVTVALLTAVAAAESGRPTLVFLSKEAVRLAIPGVATGVACAGDRSPTRNVSGRPRGAGEAMRVHARCDLRPGKTCAARVCISSPSAQARGMVAAALRKAH